MTELSPETLELLRRGREGAALSPNRRERLKTTILAQIAANAIAPAAAAGVAGSAAATGTVATATGTVASASAGWTSFFAAVIIGMSGTAVGAGIVHWASGPIAQTPTTTLASERQNVPTNKAAASKLERHGRSNDESWHQRIQESATQPASGVQHRVDALVPSPAEPREQQGDRETQHEETHHAVRSRSGTDRPPSASGQFAASSESLMAESPEPTPVAQRAATVSQQAPSGEPASSTPRESPPPRLAAEALKEEAQLLRQAHDALTSGNATEALKVLERCAARFPSGALAPERNAERIFALCRAGRLQEARLTANEFLRTYSVGPLAARVRSSCAGSGR